MDKGLLPHPFLLKNLLTLPPALNEKKEKEEEETGSPYPFLEKREAIQERRGLLYLHIKTKWVVKKRWEASCPPSFFADGRGGGRHQQGGGRKNVPSSSSPGKGNMPFLPSLLDPPERGGGRKSVYGEKKGKGRASPSSLPKCEKSGPLHYFLFPGGGHSEEGKKGKTSFPTTLNGAGHQKGEVARLYRKGERITGKKKKKKVPLYIFYLPCRRSASEEIGNVLTPFSP